MVDFFKVTQEDIDKASSGDRAQFVHDEEVTFTIREFKEKDVNGSRKLIVDCAVQTNSENKLSNGKQYAFFIDDKPHSVKTWVKILRCFFTDEQIAQGIDPMTLISQQFMSVAKLSVRDDKEYTNFYEFSPVGMEVEVAMAGQAEATDLPF
jgi:hypothetical protein